MNDLISRQEALNELNKLDVSDGVGISSIACGVQELAIISIQHLPSASPEQTHMVINKSKGGTTMWYQCAKCGEPSDLKDKYCRCCGRRFSNEDN